MRAADSVEVELFQQQNVLDHPLLRAGLPTALVVLVAVGPFDHDGLAVDLELAVPDLDAAETHQRRFGFEDSALLEQRQNQNVQVGFLGGAVGFGPAYTLKPPNICQAYAANCSEGCASGDGCLPDKHMGMRLYLLT